jgi:tryptophan synthase beta chain
MYTLGHGFIPESIHAGGLRYHGTAPIVAQLAHLGLVEAQAYRQSAVFEAALLFARTEGYIPAPETSHAIASAVFEAKKNDRKCIVFNYSGHGHFDMSAYDAHLAGNLEDYEHPAEKIASALKDLPRVGT